MAKRPTNKRSTRDYLESEEYFDLLRDTVGMDEESLRSLDVQIKKCCAPSLNTRRKRVLRFMRAIRLYEKECSALLRAHERYRKLMGPMGATPEPLHEEKERRAMKKSGLYVFHLRRSEMQTNHRRWMPSASDFISDDKDRNWQKLIRVIAFGDPYSLEKVAEVLEWGKKLRQVYNPKRREDE